MNSQRTNADMIVIVLGLLLNLLMSMATVYFKILSNRELQQIKLKQKGLKRDYQSVVENFAEGIVVISDKGQIQFINSNLQAFIEQESPGTEIMLNLEKLSEEDHSTLSVSNQNGLKRKIFSGFLLSAQRPNAFLGDSGKSIK